MSEQNHIPEVGKMVELKEKLDELIKSFKYVKGVYGTDLSMQSKDALEQFISDNFVPKNEYEEQVKKEPINFFLSNILTYLNQEDITELTNKLERRTNDTMLHKQHEATKLALAKLQTKYLELDDRHEHLCETSSSQQVEYGKEVSDTFCSQFERQK